MLKNLATCTPKEFLVQTNRIRKLAKTWLIDTGVLNIRKTVQDLADGVADEIGDANDENDIKNKATKAVIDRLDDILEKLLDTDVDKTVELLCYCCFVPPKDADKHQMWEFMESISEMMSNEAVLGFFMSLVGLTRMTTSA